MHLSKNDERRSHGVGGWVKEKLNEERLRILRRERQRMRQKQTSYVVNGGSGTGTNESHDRDVSESSHLQNLCTLRSCLTRLPPILQLTERA